MTMPTPEPLELTDPTGDRLRAHIGLGETYVITADDGYLDTELPVILSREQVRELIRWLCSAIGEPAGLAVLPDTFAGRTDEDEPWVIANRSLGSCVRCGHDIHAGAFVERVNEPEVTGWAHDECGPPRTHGDPARAPLAVLDRRCPGRPQP